MRIAAALLALAALTALADEGFFRHQETPPHEAADASQQADTAPPIPCALVVRYNVVRPVAQELTYEGEPSACFYSFEPAITQVAQAFGKELSDPLGLGAPPYDCAIVVSFFAGLPTPPTTSLIGGGACPATMPAAIAAAKRNVDCVFVRGTFCAQ